MEGAVAEGGILRAGHGIALRLLRGQSVEIINTSGTQCFDTWALNAVDTAEVMSMEHTRSRISRIVPQVGDLLYTSRRHPILCLAEDTSPGVHDTLLCACNQEIYRELGCAEGHRSCEDNFHEALAEVGVALSWTPAPFNMFMNTSVGAQDEVIRGVPRSQPNDKVRLRAEMDAIVVLSSCPQDVTLINGADRTPRDAEYRIV